jgi:hypothetical protein
MYAIVPCHQENAEFKLDIKCIDSHCNKIDMLQQMSKLICSMDGEGPNFNKSGHILFLWGILMLVHSDQFLVSCFGLCQTGLVMENTGIPTPT